MNDKETILIVDDNEFNLNILVESLRNYNVVPAISGLVALEILTQQTIDLILLDVMMPNMDGYDVCSKIKNNENTKNIPVIFLTAKNDINDIKKGFDVGAVDYIVKPFSTIELLSRVNTQLQLKSYQENLRMQVDQEIKKNKLQEQIIFQNSKQAEIGELLMHIAHQWKQPLSELGSVNLLNTMFISKEKIDLEKLQTNFSRTSDILEFMSKTVETFQNFYKPNTKNSFFDISSTINKAINIVSATFDYENIKLNINKITDSTVYANQNEYAQVILSILNNAKDIFIIRDTIQRTIIITISENKNKSLVTIEDNAGGISLENIDDVFSPYVSGKGDLGIGLYMSESIIKKNNGSLFVENTQKGAKFTITL